MFWSWKALLTHLINRCQYWPFLSISGTLVNRTSFRQASTYVRMALSSLNCFSSYWAKASVVRSLIESYLFPLYSNNGWWIDEIEFEDIHPAKIQDQWSIVVVIRFLHCISIWNLFLEVNHSQTKALFIVKQKFACH
jgi:hypothetical protein